jgi:hypothetical protein
LCPIRPASGQTPRYLAPFCAGRMLVSPNGGRIQ